MIEPSVRTIAGYAIGNTDASVTTRSGWFTKRNGAVAAGTNSRMHTMSHSEANPKNGRALTSMADLPWHAL